MNNVIRNPQDPVVRKARQDASHPRDGLEGFLISERRRHMTEEDVKEIKGKLDEVLSILKSSPLFVQGRRSHAEIKRMAEFTVEQLKNKGKKKGERKAYEERRCKDRGKGKRLSSTN